MTVEAAYSKRRRTDVLPLHPDLAARLREWLLEGSAVEQGETVVFPICKASEAKPTRLWPGAWAEKRHAAAMLREDLAAAGIDYEENGRVFDFHAMRHQFISALAKAGVHPKTAQELARHSTITLTLDRYSHVGLYDQGAAVASIPVLPSPQQEAARATGTDDPRARVAIVLPKRLPKPDAPRCISSHSPAQVNEPVTVDVGAAKTPVNQREVTDLQGSQSGEIGIRTRDAGFPTYRISNPALSATQPSLRGAGATSADDFRPLCDIIHSDGKSERCGACAA